MKIERLYLAPYKDPGVNDLRVHVCNKLNELIDAHNREEKSCWTTGCENKPLFCEPCSAYNREETKASQDESKEPFKWDGTILPEGHPNNGRFTVPKWRMKILKERLNGQPTASTTPVSYAGCPHTGPCDCGKESDPEKTTRCICGRWYYDGHIHSEKPTACCEKCNKGGYIGSSERWCTNSACKCHHPASKIEEIEICCTHDALNPDKIAGCECSCHAPHETPTKTCTCPHCDLWRCDHRKV